ncbi:MAG: putative FMN-binding negative transcriptional regulator [Betaproteobacteria bacterium]|nr:putative FMN-binding negative transcriptional regulator [Betaproteobacteria bacterium]
MYLPKHFEQKDQALALEVMRAHGFAMLVGNDDEGAPYVSHLPLVMEEKDGAIRIEGHVAKPNPHWRYLQARPRVLVVFQGPHAYMSPKVYPDLTRVPSWSYIAVHAYGEAQLIDDPEGKDALLKRLIGVHEPGYARQWRDLGQEFQLKMLGGIVGFAITVNKLEAKFKINQHRPEAHAAMHAAYAQGTPEEQALARWMERLGHKV